ncbi:MAG: glycosyltransferase family 39 protein [Candidatus Pacebacteria bacterium]|nr:glycosyltransferase family 39 protein [Candidatus Paceibacterota bacterium]
MTTVLNFMNRHKILLLILAAAFLIRIVGIGYGLPHEFIGDEFVQVAVSLKMIDAKALTPNFPTIFYHQPLSAYISALGIGAYLFFQLIFGKFGSIAAMRDYYIVHPTDLLIVTRFMAVLCGALTVWLLYLIGRDLFNRRAGLIAAFLGVFDFLFIYNQHTGRVWSYMSVFIALALWASVKLFKEDKFKNYLLSAGASLLAAANLLPGLLTFIPSVVARFKWNNKKIWIAFGAIILGLILIFLMSPRGFGAVFFRFDIFSGSKILETVAKTTVEYQVAPTPVFNRIFDTFITLFNYLPVYFILFLAGMAFLWREDRKKFFFFASFPFFYYLFIGPFYTFGWVARCMVPFSVYFVLGSAYLLDLLAKKYFNDSKKVLIIGVLAVSLPSIVMSVLFDVKISRDDTRTQSVNWIYKNLPEDSRIIDYSGTDEVINQDRGILELMKKTGVKELSTKQKFLLSAGDEAYPRPEYFVLDLREFNPGLMEKDFFKNNKFIYYRKTDWGSKTTEDFGYLLEGAFAKKELIAKFSPFADGVSYGPEDLGNVHDMQYPILPLIKAQRFGPVVEVYKISFK